MDSASLTNANHHDVFHSRREHLNFIVNLTESMLASAEKEEWENLIDVETERRQHLEQFFATTTSADEVIWVKQAVERIIDIDKQVIQISEKSKQSLVKERNMLSKGQLVSKAYSQENTVPML